MTLLTDDGGELFGEVECLACLGEKLRCVRNYSCIEIWTAYFVALIQRDDHAIFAATLHEQGQTDRKESTSIIFIDERTAKIDDSEGAFFEFPYVGCRTLLSFQVGGLVA